MTPNSDELRDEMAKYVHALMIEVVEAGCGGGDRDQVLAGVRQMRAEIERLKAEAADFHMRYRMKCDEETKRQAVEIMGLHAALSSEADENERLRAELERLLREQAE